jgi:predicted ArsR family transcriptional regulator
LAAYRDQKFLESTRGRIVTLIRRARRTVKDLARKLDLTDNGVRAHLAVLERDGLVRQRGSVRRGGNGGGKPAYVYDWRSSKSTIAVSSSAVTAVRWPA